MKGRGCTFFTGCVSSEAWRSLVIKRTVVLRSCSCHLTLRAPVNFRPLGADGQSRRRAARTPRCRCRRHRKDRPLRVMSRVWWRWMSHVVNGGAIGARAAARKRERVSQPLRRSARAGKGQTTFEGEVSRRKRCHGLRERVRDEGSGERWVEILTERPAELQRKRPGPPVAVLHLGLHNYQDHLSRSHET